MGSREQSLDDLTNNAMAIWSRVTGKQTRYWKYPFLLHQNLNGSFNQGRGD